MSKQENEIKKSKERIILLKLKRKILMGDIKEEEIYQQWIVGEITEKEYGNKRSENWDKYNCLNKEHMVYCFSINNLERDLEHLDDRKRVHKEYNKKLEDEGL